MANPMTNICANFDQVGQVRSRVARRRCPARAPAQGHTRSGVIAREHNARDDALSHAHPDISRVFSRTQAFAQHYYNTFDADRSQLGPLYNDTYSMLNFEHSNERPGQYKGSAAIVEKLKSLPFQQVKHRVVTLDTQPSPNGGVVVVVCGDLLIDGEQHAQKFSQTFQLMPTEAAGLAPGSYFIFNDIFRLNVG